MEILESSFTSGVLVSLWRGEHIKGELWC